tara:strand:- start:838 stop:1983 length:1146 start_codon:yes stop_codon:yes gene_type:complete
MSNLKYITYQSFPSNKANTIQTIDNLKYLKKFFNIEVIFPIREKESSDNLQLLSSVYGNINGIKFNGKNHFLPFGRINLFERTSYHLSHYIWSKNICKNYSRDEKNYFFTRSDWIFYFLSKKGINITFECHQLSKLRKLIIRNIIKYPNSKIIFLNKQLFIDSKILKKYKYKTKILGNGVDIQLFESKYIKKNNQILFIGNFKRFNEDRNLKFIINCFKDEEINSKYTLNLIGGNEKECEELDVVIKEFGLSKFIKITERQNRSETIKQIMSSDIGLLINSRNNEHSYKYTSPLKYFEYLYGRLKVIAVDFPSHKELPFSDNISFFSDNDEKSFKEALFKTQNIKPINISELNNLTLDYRSLEIYNFITNARPEGLEPPTL